MAPTAACLGGELEFVLLGVAKYGYRRNGHTGRMLMWAITTFLTAILQRPFGVSRPLIRDLCDLSNLVFKIKEDLSNCYSRKGGLVVTWVDYVVCFEY